MQIVKETPTFSVAIVGRVVVTAAASPLTVEQVGILMTAYERLDDNGAGRFASITLSQALKPGASDDARAALASMSRRYKDRDVGSAVVMPAGGFQASVVRAIISGLTLIAGGNLKVFSDVDAGLAWLEALMATKKLEGYDADVIRRTLATLAKPQKPE